MRASVAAAPPPIERRPRRFVARRVREEALHLRPRRAGAFADDAAGRAVDEREVRRAGHRVAAPTPRSTSRPRGRGAARSRSAVHALLGRVLGDDDQANVGGEAERLGPVERVPEPATREASARQEREQRAVLHADARECSPRRRADPRPRGRRPDRGRHRRAADRRAAAARPGASSASGSSPAPSACSRRRISPWLRSSPITTTVRSTSTTVSITTSAVIGSRLRGPRRRARGGCRAPTRPAPRSSRRAARTRRRDQMPVADRGERRPAAAASSGRDRGRDVHDDVRGGDRRVGRAEASARGSRRPHEQAPRRDRERAVHDGDRDRGDAAEREAGDRDAALDDPERADRGRRRRESERRRPPAGCRRAGGSSTRPRTRAPHTRRRTAPPPRRRSRRCSRGRCSLGPRNRARHGNHGARRLPAEHAASLRRGLTRLGDPARHAGRARSCVRAVAQGVPASFDPKRRPRRRRPTVFVTGTEPSARRSPTRTIGACRFRRV